MTTFTYTRQNMLTKDLLGQVSSSCQEQMKKTNGRNLVTIITTLVQI